VWLTRRARANVKSAAAWSAVAASAVLFRVRQDGCNPGSARGFRSPRRYDVFGQLTAFDIRKPLTVLDEFYG
jgi:hypothetical protein